MWEKLNKEERNNKFQRLKEDEKHATEVENGYKNGAKGYTGIQADKKHKTPFAWRLMVIAAALLLAVILIISVKQLTNIESLSARSQESVWRTSAHVHVYTYAQLARLAAHRDAALRRARDRAAKVVSCYYNLPDQSQTNQLLPQNIHPHLCTHINVAFARVVNKQISLDESQYQYLQDVVKLREKNPDLKILLSVGGASDDSGFSDMVIDHASRKVFIRSLKNILRNYTLNGVDLDWEFPALHKTVGVRGEDLDWEHPAAHRTVGGRERQHFSQLLREIRMEYNREKRDYILTVATTAPETIVRISYDIDQINQYVDYVNIMTYDYHYYTKLTPFTGFNSPLYPRSTEQTYLATLNINYTVHMYIDKGLDRNKIVVGIPTYGHTFCLVNANNPRVGSPASGYGSPGNYINYPDVCTMLRNSSVVTVKQDSEAKVPYLYKDTDWISYDTPESVMEKAKFIKDNNLRGAMIYSLNADDYAGTCNTGLGQPTQFPLSESVKNTLIFNSSTIIIN